ncbi:MAG: T9SS type A sorting domain-containing protein [Sphingobacteriaceae bacterium]|nr:MAG: T9SS type A sorting domain-containing protein [Sphingobacteriaceae bacterium]
MASRTGRASAYINNYNYSNNGSRDELFTPQITYTGVDSVFLNFDVAATTYSYPGSTAIPLDTLELLVTTDCGASFTSIYKKWGNELQTVSDPNSPQTTEFVPTNRNQWRNEQLNLSAYTSRSPIQVVFRNTTNFENNIFIDNVNLSTKTLPAKLKEQGYLIYPVPFASTFYIQHYLQPTELRGIAVYNSIGQRVWTKEYNSTGATSLIQVDLSRYANDVYTVVLRYTNRTISQKIIKAR